MFFFRCNLCPDLSFRLRFWQKRAQSSTFLEKCLDFFFAKVKTASYICRKINIYKYPWEKISADVEYLAIWRQCCSP